MTALARLVLRDHLGLLALLSGGGLRGGAVMIPITFMAGDPILLGDPDNRGRLILLAHVSELLPALHPWFRWELLLCTTSLLH